VAELNRPALGHPEMPAEALEMLEILVRAHVPKNTSNAKFCLAAVNVLRVDAARCEAAQQVLKGI